MLCHDILRKLMLSTRNTMTKSISYDNFDA